MIAMGYYNKKVKKDKKGKKKDEVKYSLRSARCYKATNWIKLKAEYEIMGWVGALPDNPLQHTTPKLTEKTYAEPNAGDK